MFLNVYDKTTDISWQHKEINFEALVINYVKSILELYGTPESQRVNYIHLLYIGGLFSYVSEELLQSYIPSMISETIAILWNWALIISEKSVCITGKNETGFPGSSIMIWDIIGWVASYSLCHNFDFSVHFYGPWSPLYYLKLFEGTKWCAIIMNVIFSTCFSMEELEGQHWKC